MGSSLRMAAAMTGRAAFLLPEMPTVPCRGVPPEIRRSSILVTVADLRIGVANACRVSRPRHCWWGANGPLDGSRARLPGPPRSATTI